MAVDEELSFGFFVRKTVNAHAAQILHESVSRSGSHRLADVMGDPPESHYEQQQHFQADFLPERRPSTNHSSTIFKTCLTS